MVLGDFSQQVESLRRCAEKLQRLNSSQSCLENSLSGSDESNPDFSESVRTIEKLLHQQHEELVAARAEIETERRYYQALRTLLPDGHLVTDANGIIQDSNQVASLLLNTHPEALLGQVIVDFVTEEARPTIYHALQRAREAQAVDGLEIAFKPYNDVPIMLSVKTAVVDEGERAAVHWLLRDLSEQKRTEQELRMRLRQQAAVAALGQEALTGANLSTLMDHTVATVASVLQVEYCKVLELLPDGEALLLRAGVGWQEGLVGHATVGAGADSQAGYTLLSDEPVIVEDLRAESRFKGPPLLRDHGVVSGMSVIIEGSDRPFGVLGAHTTARRTFTKDDINFLQSVANVLAAAIERRQVEEKLREARDQLESILRGVTDGITAYDAQERLIYANDSAAQILGYPSVEALAELALPDLLQELEIKDESGKALAPDQFPCIQALRGIEIPEESFQCRISRAGEERWLAIKVTPIRDEEGRMQLAINFFRDITEKVRAYELLEQRVQERTRDLSTLLAISNASASSHELEPLLDLILDHLKEMVDYTAAAIWHTEAEETKVLGYRGPLPREQVEKAALNLEGETSTRPRLRLEGPPAIEQAEDVSAPANIFRSAADEPAEGQADEFRSWMMIPLTVQGQATGGLGLVHTDPDRYTTQDAALAKAVANQIALAIEQAQLYKRAQEFATLQERRRLARDLHDSVSQLLFSASLIAEILPRLLEHEPSEAVAALQDLRKLTHGALAEMRMLLLELRPAALSEVELEELLRQLVKATAGRSGVDVTLTVTGQRTLPSEVHLALFHIAQEALNNAHKHAEADRIAVSLHSQEGGIRLGIQDDGKGFDSQQIPTGHFGLAIMRERAETIGATLRVESQPGRGTMVEVIWTSSHAAEP